jgi:hypothetical protein
MIAQSRACANCGCVTTPRGGLPPSFCARCGARLPFAEPPYASQGSPPLRPGASSRAIIALVLGIASLVLLPPIIGIVAILVGNSALNQIRLSGGRLGGRGLAIAGIVLGCISFSFGVLWFLRRL